MVKKIITTIDSSLSLSCLKGAAFSFLLILTIFVFSFYAFFYGRNISKYGDILLVILFFITLPRYCGSQQKKCSNVLVVLFWSFLAIILSSVLFPPSIYADIGWLKKSLYRLMLAAGIVLSASNVTSLDKKVVRWGGVLLCLSLFTLSILVSYWVVGKNIFNNVFPFDVVRFAWNDKYYAFWFLFLMWSVVALLTNKGLVGKFFSRTYDIFSNIFSN